MRRLLIPLIAVLGFFVMRTAVHEGMVGKATTPVATASPLFAPKVWDFPGHNLW